MIGSYVIKVYTSGMPQRVASGFNKVFEGFTGASYTPIAYLGSKTVNGTNHAILAEQKLIVKDDVKSIVLLVLNEKPGDIRGDSFEIVEIKTLLTDATNTALGGIHIAPTTDIPKDAMEVFEGHFGGFFGANNTPFALLATQMVNGVAYYFAVDSTMVTNPVGDSANVITTANNKSIQIVKVYSNYSQIETKEVISGTAEVDENEEKSDALGYAFTWLKDTNWP